MLTLSHSGVSIAVDPARGGGITGFTKEGVDLFQPERLDDRSALGLSCFALVPFANRIGHGRFAWRGKTIDLPVNCPAASASHALHGHGWQNAWSVESVSASELVLSYRHDADDWPWNYEARQTIKVRDDGYSHAVSLTNLSDCAMPAGLGLHPYFPKEGASLEMSPTRVWPTGQDELPGPRVGWEGGVELKPQDRAFWCAADPITIRWRTHRLSIVPDPQFTVVHVYVPSEEAFFCVEPVSHPPNDVSGMRVLATGESWSTTTSFLVSDRA